MTDISPVVREYLERRIYKNRQVNRAENRIADKAAKGKATFIDANDYAECVGQDMAEAIMSLSGAELPDGMMYYNIADKALRPVLGTASGEILDFTDGVFVRVDSEAGIGLLPIRPSQADKIQGIIDLASSRKWDEVKLELSEVAVTFARKVVDESIQVNSEFRFKAGRSPKIIRTPDRSACDWCRDVAGTYNYYKVSDKGNPVFRRHDNCKCTVVYDAGDKTKRKTVWEPSAQDKQARIEREKELTAQMEEKDRRYSRVY